MSIYYKLSERQFLNPNVAKLRVCKTKCSLWSLPTLISLFKINGFLFEVILIRIGFKKTKLYSSRVNP